MNWKKEWADYFNFGRRDRIGILVLAGIIVAIFLVPSFLPSPAPLPLSADTSLAITFRKLEYKQSQEANSSEHTRNDDNMAYRYNSSGTGSTSIHEELFEFDPNILSEEGWKKLGLKDKTVQTIIHYREKGGQFRKAEDLKRVYGLSPAQFEKLFPYIRIEQKAVVQNPVSKPSESHNFHITVIDINTADTASLIALPGIGSKLAARIISFRDKLGGFYSLSQVGETYGLPDSTFQKIKAYLKLETGSVKKININTATIDDLKTHPYIRYNIASAIVAYRNEHGLFSAIKDIKKVVAVTEEVYQKIEAYLTTE